MITRSLSRPLLPGKDGERRGPVVGPEHKGVFPFRKAARRPDPPPTDSRASDSAGGPKRRGNTQSNNYWSASTYAPNSNNAWIVNFNDGNVNANNKPNNNLYVRAVRGGT